MSCSTNSLGASPVVNVNLEYNPELTFSKLKSQAQKYENITLIELIKLSNYKTSVSLVSTANEVALIHRIAKILQERKSLIRIMERISRFYQSDGNSSNSTTNIQEEQLARLAVAVKQDTQDFVIFKAMIANERKKLKQFLNEKQHGIGSQNNTKAASSFLETPNPFLVSYSPDLDSGYSSNSDTESQATFLDTPRLSGYQEGKISSTSTPFLSSESTPVLSGNQYLNEKKSSPVVLYKRPKGPFLTLLQTAILKKAVSNFWFLKSIKLPSFFKHPHHHHYSCSTPSYSPLMSEKHMYTNNKYPNTFHENPNLGYKLGYTKLGQRRTRFWSKPSTRFLIVFLLFFLALLSLFCQVVFLK